MGPERGAEPGVEHVRVELEARTLQHRRDRVVGLLLEEAELHLDRRRGVVTLEALERLGGAQAAAVGEQDPGADVVAVELALQHRLEHQELRRLHVAAPDRDPVAPPELPADAPVALLAEPPVVHVAVALRVGVEGDLLARAAVGERGQRAGGRVERGLGEAGASEFLVGAAAHHDAAVDVAHVHEPLLAEVGLDDGLGPVRVVDLQLAVLDPVEQPERVEVLEHLRARLEAVEAGVLAACL